MKFITIKESHYVSDLAVLKSRLESEGIQCRLKNELTTQVINYIPSMQVELQVAESDLDRVKQFLVETGELPESAGKTVCPKCGSEKVKMKLSFKKRVQVLFSVIAAALFITSLPMDKIFANARFKCLECGNEF